MVQLDRRRLEHTNDLTFTHTEPLICFDYTLCLRTCACVSVREEARMSELKTGKTNREENMREREVLHHMRPLCVWTHQRKVACQH